MRKGSEGITEEGGNVQPRQLAVMPPRRLLSWHVEVDAIQVALFVVVLCTRLWRLDYPRAIVFDELHHGRFAAMYLKNTFYFDSHPPLAKMLLAAAGYVAGWDGECNFDQIGTPYPVSVPVWALRLVPAVCGSLAVPLFYEVVLLLGCAGWTATLAALMLILDNALLTQSRFMFIDGFLLFIMLVAVLCLLKFRQANTSCPFSQCWWMWLVLLAVFSTATICTKYIGLMTYALCMTVIARDLWTMLEDKTISDLRLVHHALSRGVVLVLLPLVLYVAVFFVHLSVLHKAGPHDDVMTSAFQASLQGGLAAITKGQPLEVVYGSQVTLRHALGKSCWLHSHAHLYPLRYPDGRGSSHQQQVTCYTYKDVNNWWIVKNPWRNSLVVDEPVQPVRHGDVVQLIHGVTSRALNSHDVAASMSPQYQEVTCYIDYNISSVAQNLWRVEIQNEQNEGPTWKTIQSQIRLIHVNSSQALKLTGAQLGDWGFYQYEVATDRAASGHYDNAAVWNVEEHRYTRTSSQEGTERDLVDAELLPMETQTLGFLSKFWELQVKMLWSQYDSVTDHRYSSDPLSWPLLQTNVAYWMDEKQTCQVQLVGNPVLWWSGSAGCALYLLLLLLYLVRRHRHCYDISQELWEQYVLHGAVCGGGYLLHLLPYFLLTDCHLLFLHLYLPALLFQLLLLATLIEHVYMLIRSRSRRMWRQAYVLLVLVWLGGGVACAYWSLVPLSYGAPCLDANTVRALQRRWWSDAWDFIVPPPRLGT